MTVMPSRAIAGAVLVASFAVPSFTLAQSVEDIALTTSVVEQFIQSYPEVKKATEEVGDKYDIDVSGDSAADRWGAWVAASGAYGELNGIVTPYGFSDFGNWLQVTISVAKAYAFAEQGGELDSQMSAAVAEIQNNPNIPEAQKKMLMEQMQGAMGAVASVRPSQENIDAVTPYIDQLRVLFE